MYFFDVNKNVFLNDDVNYIPDDAIAVSDEDFYNYLDKRNQGGEIYVEQGILKITPIKPTPYHHWNGSAWVISPENQTALLEQQRQEVQSKINAKRDECVNGGVYVPEINKWVDTDDVGRATLVEIKADFDLNGKDNTYTLICADNSAQTLDFHQFKAVWDAVKNLKEKMFENAYMHKVLLEADDNPEHYDYSIGWAKTYREYLNEQTN